MKQVGGQFCYVKKFKNKFD